MRIPFDSLDPNAWLAWSDYSRDCDREKAADWGVKVAKALDKFARSGSEVRMMLCVPEARVRFGYRGRFECVVDSACVMMSTGRVELPYTKETRKHHTSLSAFGYDWGRFYWRPLSYFKRKYPDIARDALFISPVSFSDPWKWPRLSQKFFQCVVSRARGIKLKEVESV